MIVDTSALVAISATEDGWEDLSRALAREQSLIPAPVVVEYTLVTSIKSNEPNAFAHDLLRDFLARRAVTQPFTAEDAALSTEAHRLYGRGNGRGGKLNMLDIMVYCMAKRLDRPILCTGRDFASTDARIHAASRGW